MPPVTNAGQACYRTTQLLGSPVTFVLSTAGHIQSLINPPGKSKRRYFTNAETPSDPQAWARAAQEHAGSWWPYWTQWLRDHHAEVVPAPTEFGSPAYPELCEAPGTYVHG